MINPCPTSTVRPRGSSCSGRNASSISPVTRVQRSAEEPPEYWENPSERPSLRDGRILSVFEYDSTWSHWERHPVGDEFALVITGEVDLLLDQPSGADTIRLSESQCGVIPQGAWHTLRIVRHSRLLFVTPTPALTEHRTF